MLELRKGKSSKSYENDFFRYLAAGLTAAFDRKGWGGLLMGMPASLAHENLQIDCLLITDDQIILIDFKNYSGDLELPDAASFDYGRWMINGEIPVKGGSSSNPYKQIGKQRIKLIRMLERKVRVFDRTSVSTMVCFHRQVNIIGEVPQRILGFDIVDSETVFNKIVDIVDVQAENRDYLKPYNRLLFTEKLFTAPEYQISVTIETIESEEADVDKPTDREPIKIVDVNDITTDTFENYGVFISEFLLSDDRVLIIAGNTKSGKTGFIPRIREIAFGSEYIEVPVFAYSNRLKKRMLRSHPEIQEVDSLYGTIFDFWNEEVDENYRKTIPVKVVNGAYDESLQGKVLYVIDDSQLISNSSIDSETTQFGTGCLLDDVFSYLQLDKHPERKVIFIGDTSRISYSLKVENAMNADYLEAYLDRRGIKTGIRSIVFPPSDSDSEIIKVCNKLSVGIGEESFNSLIITSNGNVSIGGAENQISLLKAAYENPMHNKILVYSIKKANQINLWIKKKIAQNGAEIGAGDTIVFYSTTSAYTPDYVIDEDVPFSMDEQPFNFDKPKRIDNGSFATVLSVDHASSLSVTRDIKGETVTLSFIPCQVKLQDSSLLQIYVIDNYLKANKAELGTIENIAYQITLRSLRNDYFSKYKFEDSDEYKRMVAKNERAEEQGENPYYQMNENGEYRLVSDSRSLPQELKDYRKRLEYRLLHDQSSEYFKVYYASRVKYAWAMTVNKAMAYSFDSVYFDTSQGESHGRTNKDYYKWLYTGFAIADHRVELINWKPISPFMRTSFNSTLSKTAPKVRNIIFRFSNNEEAKDAEFEAFIQNALLLSGWEVMDVSPRPNLEIVKLQKGETALELFFDYNRKGEMKPPRLKRGNIQDLEEVANIIERGVDAGAISATGDLNQCGNMSEFFQELLALLSSRDISASLLMTQKWMVILEFRKANDKADVHIWYDSHGMISKFNFIGGRDSLYLEIVSIIKEAYSLDE
jgi:hypothetical protein